MWFLLVSLILICLHIPLTRSKSRIALLWLLPGVLCLPGWAQKANLVRFQQPPRMIFERLGAEIKLSQGSARALFQDRRGFIWIGTQSGLNRFDGSSFKVFYHDDEDPHSMPDDFVNALEQDHDGYLWVGTQHGLSRYDPETHQFKSYHATGKPGEIQHDQILGLTLDKKGRLWVASAGGVDLLYKEGRFRNFITPDPNQIYADNQGTVWVSTVQGLYYFDENDEMIRVEPEKDPQNLAYGSSVSMVEDHNGDLWVSTHLAVCRINAAGRKAGTFDYRVYLFGSTQKNFPTTLGITTLHVDSTNVLRAGTFNTGLYQYDPTTDTFENYNYDPNDFTSLPNVNIFEILEDRSGNLYFGTAGSGVARWIKSKARFPVVRPGPGPLNSPSHFIWSVEEGPNGHLWLGSQGQGLYEVGADRKLHKQYMNNPDDSRSLPGNVVRSLAFDQDGVLWLGTHGNGVAYMDPESKRFTRLPIAARFVDEIFVDSRNWIWMGMRGSGVYMYDKDTRQIINYNTDGTNSVRLGASTINEIYEYDEDTIWVGHFRGLDRIDLETGIISAVIEPKREGATKTGFRVRSIFKDSTQQLWLGTDHGLGRMTKVDNDWKLDLFDTTHGLPDNVVYNIAEDKEGALWLSTNKGLSRFQPGSGTFTNYASEDGLQSNEFNTGAHLISSRGEFVFCGVNGCNAFYPDRVRPNPVEPQMVITDFKRFDMPIPLPSSVTEIDEIVQSYDQNTFSIVYAGLEYTNQQKNQYAYMLEGYDEDWRKVGNRRMATYTRVPPGEYTFQVKGTNNDQVWSKTPAMVRITITPPFWQTWWFRLLCLLTLGLIIWLGYKRLMSVKIKRARMENELATARDMQLGLMPLSQPKLKGYDLAGVCRPADHVGGDYYDYLPMANDLWGLALVDVNTRAMEGAMTTVMSSGLMHAESLNHTSPAKILANMNAATFRKTNRKTFVAMALAVLDPEARTLTFTNAGLPPLLIFRKGEVQFYKGKGLRVPLGAMREVAYEETTVELLPNDLVVIYTDGLNEAMSADMKPFDYNGIEQCLAALPADASARTTVNELLRAVHLHEGMAESHDDVTLVVLKVHPE